ncbi:hypothetical protein BLOT_010116 [Blomia tropicalis]|nr:hypothetical protein BLOT_010116 [Blomia tropicalis]
MLDSFKSNYITLKDIEKPYICLPSLNVNCQLSDPDDNLSIYLSLPIDTQNKNKQINKRRI